MTIEKFKGLHPDLVVDEKSIVFIKGGGDPPPWPEDPDEFDPGG